MKEFNAKALSGKVAKRKQVTLSLSRGKQIQLKASKSYMTPHG